MFAWADALGLAGAVQRLRASAAAVREHVPDVVLYSVPDALWQLAFAYTIFRLSAGARLAERVAWCAVPIALGLGLELAQAAHVIEGTFDPIDLALSGAAIGAAWLAHRRGGSP